MLLAHVHAETIASSSTAHLLCIMWLVSIRSTKTRSKADGCTTLLVQSFDELVLLKPGGRMIYCGPTGHNSQDLVEFFESLDGVPRVQEGINPATWMLEVTRPAEERRLGIDFAQVYQESSLYR